MNSDTDVFELPRDTDTLGGRISRAREIAGYSEADLANAIGVRRETLRAWESDRSEPRANRLIMLSGVLNVPPVWLIHGVGVSPAASEANPEIQTILAQMRRLEDLQQQTRLAVAAMAGALERLSATS